MMGSAGWLGEGVGRRGKECHFILEHIFSLFNHFADGNKLKIIQLDVSLIKNSTNKRFIQIFHWKEIHLEKILLESIEKGK